MLSDAFSSVVNAGLRRRVACLGMQLSGDMPYASAYVRCDSGAQSTSSNMVRSRAARLRKRKVELGSTLNKCIEHAERAGNGEHVENSRVNVADASRGATASTIAAGGAIENAIAADVAGTASEAPEARKVKKSSSTMRSLLCLAMGGFALGFAEFAMMGILPSVAQGMDVSIPYAGNYISAYAVGVCFGTLFLVLGHNISPKKLLVFFCGAYGAGKWDGCNGT